MNPVINVTGPVTVNISPKTDKSKKPSIPVNPFTQQCVLEVPNGLLLFNSYVANELNEYGEESTDTGIMEALETELANLKNLLKHQDYNAELLTEYTSKIAAAAAALCFRKGGEMRVNGQG